MTFLELIDTYNRANHKACEAPDDFDRALRTEALKVELMRRWNAVQAFRGTEATRILDILDGIVERPVRTGVDEGCNVHSNGGRRCMYPYRNHPDLHRARVGERYEEWK